MIALLLSLLRSLSDPFKHSRQRSSSSTVRLLMAAARGAYTIHIIVKNGRTMLLGIVGSAADRQMCGSASARGDRSLQGGRRPDVVQTTNEG